MLTASKALIPILTVIVSAPFVLMIMKVLQMSENLPVLSEKLTAFYSTLARAITSLDKSIYFSYLY
jgi:hypothetical protein